MPIPDFQTLMLPLLELTGDGKPHPFGEVADHLALQFRLTEEERRELLPSGRQARFDNRVGWTATYLKKSGLLQPAGRGRFEITDRGRAVLTDRPAVLDVKYLTARFPEAREFTGISVDTAMFDRAEGTWDFRDEVAAGIREKLERSLPDERVRRQAMELLAFAIENADEERADAWAVGETMRGLVLMTGRLQACKVTRSWARVGVVGPIGESVRSALAAEAEEEFRSIPGGVMLKLPVEHAGQALELLKDEINLFVDAAMARVRRTVSLEGHIPEAVRYVAEVVGRDLPQPDPLSEDDVTEGGDAGADDETVISREARLRGRAPIFEVGHRSIGSLLNDVEMGVLALPDLQRPFVWEDRKVRDLLDSLFIGFPVGTLVLWHVTTERDARALGAERSELRATTLVIDGQQRLTSLHAVLRGAEVVGKDGVKRRIRIAFRPRDGRFEVADAAIRNDPEYLPDVTELWAAGRLKQQIKRQLVTALRDAGRVVDEAYEDACDANLERAHLLADYRFPTVDIRKTSGSRDAEATEEDVADIFVRINNQGTRLGQADFVLTLLSVFHGDLRDRFEERARTMSEEDFVPVDTQQLLRAACAVAFGRARMSAIYRSLRGVDPVSGEAHPAGRAKRIAELDQAATECLDDMPWRDYVLRVKHVGFVTPALVASKNAIVNAYAFYVRGRRAGVEKHRLESVIGRWLFTTLLTARYSGSSETAFEEDLARVSGLDAEGFVSGLDEAMVEAITGDYWTHALPAALRTSRGRAPAALAFRAAQVVLGARALFSDQFLRNLLDAPAGGRRAASEAHHLFPQAYLQARGVTDRRLVNQIANLADVGWSENVMAGSRGPADYVPKLRERLRISDDDWGRACAEHALPLGWESMEYEAFLDARRRRMADLVHVAYRQLGGEADAAPIAPPWFMPGAEVVWQRIAETERALRAAVRATYGALFGDRATERIRGTLSDSERASLERSLRGRSLDSDPLGIVDYLYLGQLPSLLLAGHAWAQARERFENPTEARARLQAVTTAITPVRNEIAHVREVSTGRLMKATVACADVMDLLKSSRPQQSGSSA